MPGTFSPCAQGLANAADDEVSHSQENTAINTTLINRRKRKLFLEVSDCLLRSIQKTHLTLLLTVTLASQTNQSRGGERGLNCGHTVSRSKF